MNLENASKNVHLSTFHMCLSVSSAFLLLFFLPHLCVSWFTFLTWCVIYNVLVSCVQQSGSVIHIHESILFQILLSFRLLHNIEKSSLCYTVRPCCSSVSHVGVYPMDRRAWWAAVRGVTTSRTRLSDFTFTFHCIGEGNGNPLQYSCLENPRDRGACWAAVYGVAQSRTQLTQLSSSSSSSRGAKVAGAHNTQKRVAE